MTINNHKIITFYEHKVMGVLKFWLFFNETGNRPKNRGNRVLGENCKLWNKVKIRCFCKNLACLSYEFMSEYKSIPITKTEYWDFMKSDKKETKKWPKSEKKSVKTWTEIPKVTKMVKRDLFLSNYHGSIAEIVEKDLFLACFGPFLGTLCRVRTKKVLEGLKEATWGPWYGYFRLK